MHGIDCRRNGGERRIIDRCAWSGWPPIGRSNPLRSQPQPAHVSAAKVHRLCAATLRSSADIIEALHWFNTTGASHLLWALSPRVELTTTGLQRLAHAAADTRAAILYSDYLDVALDGALRAASADRLSGRQHSRRFRFRSCLTDQSRSSSWAARRDQERRRTR